MNITAEINEVVRLNGLATVERNLLKSNYRLANPMYHKLLRMGNRRALYNCPEHFRYYEDLPEGYLVLPRGCVHELKKLLGRQVTVKNTTVRPEVDLKSTLELRPYQFGLPEQIVQQEQGIIRLGTGFGKTAIALKVAEKLQTRTLIIVPRKRIQEQFVDLVQEHFGFKPLTDPFHFTGSPIIVATMQSLQRLKDGERAALKDAFGLVIVDECHLAIPRKSWDVIQSFAPRYLYGMTATARRSDGQGEAIKFLFGDTLVSADLPRGKPTVDLVQFDEHIPMGEYPAIIELQSAHRGRNELIARVAVQETNERRRVLVLTKRVEHHKSLGAILKEKYPFLAVVNAIAGAKDQDFTGDVLLGTFSLLSTGIDVPELDTLIIAGDLRSDVLAEQSVGRILRLFSGKKEPKIIDVQDLGNPILRNQARERQKFYRDQGWKIQNYVHGALTKPLLI